MLKNCLISNVCATQLSNSLIELMFHYDSFTSTVNDYACEAVYLCSFKIKVTVLISLNNFTKMKFLYQNLSRLAKNEFKVKSLLLQQRYLNVKRLMTLMIVNSTEKQISLYIQVVYQILQEIV